MTFALALYAEQPKTDTLHDLIPLYFTSTPICTHKTFALWFGLRIRAHSSHPQTFVLSLLWGHRVPLLALLGTSLVLKAIDNVSRWSLDTRGYLIRTYPVGIITVYERQQHTNRADEATLCNTRQ